MPQPGGHRPFRRRLPPSRPRLGFSRRTCNGAAYRTPRVSELDTLFAALPARMFEAALTRWSLAQHVSDLERRVVAIHRKTLRAVRGINSWRPPASRLLSRRRGGNHPGRRPRHNQRAQDGVGIAQAHSPEGNAGDRRRGLYPAGSLRGGDPRRRRLFPDHQGQPADVGGRNPGRLRPGFLKWLHCLDQKTAILRYCFVRPSWHRPPHRLLLVSDPPMIDAASPHCRTRSIAPALAEAPPTSHGTKCKCLRI